LLPRLAIFSPSKSSSASAANSTFIIVAITPPFGQVVAATILFSLHTTIAPSQQLAAVVDLRLPVKASGCLHCVPSSLVQPSPNGNHGASDTILLRLHRCLQCVVGIVESCYSAQSCASCTRRHHPVTDFSIFCPVVLHLEGDQAAFSPLLQSVGVLFMLGRDNLTSHHLHFGSGTWASI
jgi:hypothetical protein